MGTVLEYAVGLGDTCDRVVLTAEDDRVTRDASGGCSTVVSQDHRVVAQGPQAGEEPPVWIAVIDMVLKAWNLFQGMGKTVVFSVAEAGKRIGSTMIRRILGRFEFPAILASFVPAVGL